MRFYSAAVQCTIGRLVWASWSNVPKSFVMAARISATVAAAVGLHSQTRCSQQQQLKQSVKSHPKMHSFAGQNTQKNPLCSATAWPSEILIWIKGSEQSPPIVSTVGISKETRSKEFHYSCCHWLHFPPSVPMNEALLAVINLFCDGFVHAASELVILQSRGELVPFLHSPPCAMALVVQDPCSAIFPGVQTLQCLRCICLTFPFKHQRRICV